ncbi:MAG: tyrosine-type recombinase/integrase [Desulfobacula sp.]|jgi:integrase|uniref:tyrosine-type recombinase/integrase n=1 Tax=Desulfobacula sp. TaxID=2593537 RepID=UPI001D910DFD|nr:tyrosine-type recombinase/integrase [Desulfobacula sp.]MBT3486281.1 tyrosine-type recombinase/integrase [Desulfobacula sp.]MBT3807191.1 tyrosine-type recombinase/integrase [Desulfobacula sp.]MBT4026163.1 tyrosine-type recombinase/integrase [Desulfobacula sp.]MBT4201378.1 tyrosine-type recombinase/integrase [Desulfobacula sp.]
MSEIIYEGPFKSHIKDHVELKQAVGYKYNTDAAHLKRFDRFTLAKYPDATVLTKKIVLDWCSKKTYEAQANQCSRASVIRQFGKYLDSIGVEAYIIPKGYYPTEKQYTPHIYPVDELTRFFAQTDKCHYCSEYPYRHLIMPVVFRMIYMCGLRVSEARLLKVGDVDLEKGILTIKHSKKANSRLVPMSDYLSQLCRQYSKKAHPFPVPEDYYFPAQEGKPMTIGNVYKNFRKFLWRAGISHGGRGYGPRVHDFRHVYAVHCLKKWVEQEKDLTAYLPVLKTYMGHDSFQDTAYYLRLTADVFPNITLKLETHYPEIIPELGGSADETY